MLLTCASSRRQAITTTVWSIDLNSHRISSEPGYCCAGIATACTLVPTSLWQRRRAAAAAALASWRRPSWPRRWCCSRWHLWPTAFSSAVELRCARGFARADCRRWYAPPVSVLSTPVDLCYCLLFPRLKFSGPTPPNYLTSLTGVLCLLSTLHFMSLDDPLGLLWRRRVTP